MDKFIDLLKRIICLAAALAVLVLSVPVVSYASDDVPTMTVTTENDDDAATTEADDDDDTTESYDCLYYNRETYRQANTDVMRYFGYQVIKNLSTGSLYKHFANIMPDLPSFIDENNTYNLPYYALYVCSGNSSYFKILYSSSPYLLAVCDQYYSSTHGYICDLYNYSDVEVRCQIVSVGLKNSDDISEYTVSKGDYTTILPDDDSSYNGSGYAVFGATGWRYTSIIDSNMNIYLGTECALLNSSYPEYNSNCGTFTDSTGEHTISFTDSTFVNEYLPKLTNCNADFTDYIPDSGTSSDESVYDSSLDWSFTMCGNNEPDYYSNYGLVINYAFPTTLWNKMSDDTVEPVMYVDYTISCRYYDTVNDTRSKLVTFKVSNQRYDELIQNGSVNVDLFKLIFNASAKNSNLLQDGTLYNLMKVLSGETVSDYEVTQKSTSTNWSTTVGTDVDIAKTGVTFGPSISYTKGGSDSSTSDLTKYNYIFEYFTVKAEASVHMNMIQTKHKCATVDLCKGENESYSLKGDDVDNLSPDMSDYATNTNYYTHDESNNNYVYYNSTTDTTKTVSSPSEITFGDIVVNVDASGGGGSSGSSGSVVQNNNNTVSIPDKVYLFLESSGVVNDNSNVTIEDDDLTDDALRNDLLDGYGLIDDASTPEKNDGYISMISGVFSGLDDDLSSLVMFGISTTIGIAVLRMIFKR